MTDEAVVETVPIVNDRGQTRNYETVASRLRRFRADHPEYWIENTVLQCDDEVVRMRCEIWLVFACNDGNDMKSHRLASAHAEEYRAASEINATSALENCETSALGRALAFLGYGSADSIASAEEVVGAKAKGAAFAAAKPGALVLIQNAAQKGIKVLETVWKQTLSAEDREACRGYITKLKKEAQAVTDGLAHGEPVPEASKEFGK